MTTKKAKPQFDCRPVADVFHANVIIPLQDKITAEVKVREAMVADWRQENGVCDRCNGDSKVWISDTLDYFYSGEYVPCEKCGGVRVECPIGQHADEQELRIVADMLDRVYYTIRAYEFNPVGLVVQVVSGRKVPLGTVGQCETVSDGQWGRQVCLVTASGERHWTSIDNVRVMDADKTARDQVFRESVGHDFTLDEIEAVRSRVYWTA